MHKTTERLYQAIKAIKSDMVLTKANVSKFINISQQALKNWEDRPTGISKQGMFDIEKQTGISAVWLESGQGDMLVKNEKNDYITFAVLDITASMGVGAINADYLEIIDTVSVARQWAKEQLGNNLSSIRVITARGDSMSSTIEDGSVLFVDESIDYFNGEGIYIIYTTDGLKAKRLQLTVSGSLNIISDNPKYPIEVISPKDIEDIRICGKVKGCWQMNKL